MWLLLVKRYISRALFILLNIILFVFFFRFFIADFGVVSGPSMEPTFNDGEFFIVSKIPLFFRPLQRLETVQVINVKNPDSLVVKRVIGLPGDTIYFYQNKVCVINESHRNGTCLDEPYLGPDAITTSRDKENKPVHIPPGHYYLLGDRRSLSSDSREYGPVERQYVLGLAIKL